MDRERNGGLGLSVAGKNRHRRLDGRWSSGDKSGEPGGVSATGV
jgi:hypothetical protein